ncbi:MAG: bifunctional demethylmenaquinone methyltransferase/2-methoxy-6-polyprenyl-1,4-benzoquinol methylase UbiE [Bacteroidales bacterium]|nr:bifunctional demethylmenaquinone methyltransferase/2-methoxy-6-polyprenyl-1,4-benzoquinol methylase UbiE [Bacteroidales bacterium]
MNSVADKSGVKQMFDSIAWRYDFLNHFLTLGIDKWWRKKAVECISSYPEAVFLDVAAGTGDLSVELARRKTPEHVIGIDISDGMLSIGKEKVKRLGLTDRIEFRNGNCEELPFDDAVFDAVTVGFGIRNFQHPRKGLSEMYRVMKKGGELVILEFSRPDNKLLCTLFDVYFCNILPFVGHLFSKHASAYTYLPQSVKNFVYGEKFTVWMKEAGFSDVSYRPLTFGVATIYKGVKN